MLRGFNDPQKRTDARKVALGIIYNASGSTGCVLGQPREGFLGCHAGSFASELKR